MAATRKITVELPEETAQRVDRRLAEGGYASQSEMVTASLNAQLDSDERLSRWEDQQLKAALAEWQAAPEKVRPVNEVFDSALARYEARKAREA